MTEESLPYWLLLLFLFPVSIFNSRKFEGHVQGHIVAQWNWFLGLPPPDAVLSYPVSPASLVLGVILSECALAGGSEKGSLAYLTWLIISTPLGIDNITIHGSSFVVHSANNRVLHLSSDFYFTRYSHTHFSTNHHHKLVRALGQEFFSPVRFLKGFCGQFGSQYQLISLGQTLSFYQG